MKINRVNSINLQNKQSFRAVSVTPQYLEELHKGIFKGQKNLVDAFDIAIDALKQKQKDNALCDIKLFKGVNVLTGDTVPTIGFFNKEGVQITQINTHQPRYNLLTEMQSYAQMIIDANSIADNFADIVNKKFNMKILG